MKLTEAQTRLLTVASQGATFREPGVEGDWSYVFPGQSRHHLAVAISCRALVRHGWLVRAETQQEQYATHYVISAAGRAAVQSSAAPVHAGPPNIKF